MSRLTRDGTAEPVSRDQILRHARGQGNIIFPVQLTTSRIGNLTRLIHTLLYVMTIHTYWPCGGGLSAMNAIGTQLHDPINTGLTRWRMAVLNKYMHAAAELETNPVSKHQIQPEGGDEQADARRDCRPMLVF